MKNYSNAYIAEYGDCKDKILGECGWGTENALLDKTGYVKRNVGRWLYMHGGSGKLILKLCTNQEVCEKNPKKECNVGDAVHY